MKSYIKFVNGLPWILKIICALPILDWIVFGIYRIAKGRIIAGLVWLLLGWNILWIIDLFHVITTKNVRFFA